MIEIVFVDGRALVEEGQLLQLSRNVIARAEASMHALEAAYSEWHHSGRTAQQEFPQSYSEWTTRGCDYWANPAAASVPSTSAFYSSMARSPPL